MAIIKLSGSKVLLKNGKPSCECCGGSAPPPTGPSVGCDDFFNRPCEGTFISYATALAFVSASSVSNTINVSGNWDYISTRWGTDTYTSVVFNESASWTSNKVFFPCGTGPNVFGLSPSSSTFTETYGNNQFTIQSTMRLFAQATLSLREIGNPRNFCLTAGFFFQVRTDFDIFRIFGESGSSGGIGSVNFSGLGVSSNGGINAQYLGNSSTFPRFGTTPSGSATATISTFINVAPP